VAASTSARGAAFWPLLALAIGSFGIGMTEFVIMGILPNVAQDLLPTQWAADRDTAIAHAGWLVSLYALGVVVGAPTIAGLVAKYPRHRVMVGLALALTVFNGLTLLAPSFGFVAVSRFVAALPHGAYFGIGGLVAADVLGPGKRAKGVAFAMLGLTVANVVGVPAGTFLGQQLGWRAAFVLVTAIFAVATIMLALTVPAHAGDASRTLRSELRVFRLPQVWLTIGVAAIGIGGFFAMYSYIAPMVTDGAGAPEWAVSAILVGVGLGMFLGNLAGGHLADRALVRTLLGGLVALSVALVALALSVHSIVALSICAFAVGFLFFVVAPALQTRLMDVAEDNPSIAASLNHSAFNLGNSLGAFVGGLVIAAGWGVAAPAWVGAGLALCGVAIALTSIRLEARDRQTRGAYDASASLTPR
jgi:MFS transporter, DHA1 family, inner membrane transport protein